MDKLNQTKPARSARCDCREMHATWSERCAQKNVVDPTRFAGDVAICESCRKFCFFFWIRHTAGCAASLADAQRFFSEHHQH